MTPKEVTKIARMDKFNRLVDMLNLSDRQKKIFYYKYKRQWRIVDIAEKLKFHVDTINEDLKIIRLKMMEVNEEELEVKPKGEKQEEQK